MSCRVFIAALFTTLVASTAFASAKPVEPSKNAPQGGKTSLGPRAGAAAKSGTAVAHDSKQNSIAATRMLAFPEKVSLGSLYKLDAKTDWTQEKHPIGQYIGQAKGNVYVPANSDIYLNGNYQLMENPQYLDALSPDDLQLLGLQGMEGNDKDFPYIGKMTGLKRLSLDGFVMTDADLSLLKNLTKLEALSVWNTGIEGTGFKDLAGLKKLRLLMLGNNVLVPAAFKYISALPALEDINAVAVPINDVGLAYLAKLPNLKKLRIPNCKDVTGKGLRALKSTARLEDIQAENTYFSIDDFLALKGLKLKKVTLPKHSYSAKDLARLKVAFPGAIFGIGGAPLDSDTKTIFAPLH